MIFFSHQHCPFSKTHHPSSPKRKEKKQQQQKKEPQQQQLTNKHTSTELVVKEAEFTTPYQDMNSINQRLPEPRSLFKVLPGRSDEDQRAQQTEDQQQQEKREEGGGGLLPLPPAVVSPGEVSKNPLKESQSPDTIPLDDSIDSQVSVPGEVTVGTNNSQQPVTTIRLSLMIELLKKRNERLNTVENEAKEVKRKLKSTQELLDVVSKKLNQSKNETKDLIQKNTLLLEEFKMMKDKEDSSLETQQLQRKELILLKVCLFVATLYIMCGGKIELVAFMALVWLAADIAR